MTLANDFTSWDSGGGDISALLKKLLSQSGGSEPLQMPTTQSSAPGSDLSGILKSLAGYQYNSNGTNLAPQQNTANAIVDDSNPLFQKIYNQERGASQQNLSQAIAEASNQNRKLSMLGRTPLFDPERGGETQFRALTQGYQTAQDTARQRAREILGANLNTQKSLAEQQDANNKKKAFGFGNIADALPLVLKLLK